VKVPFGARVIEYVWIHIENAEPDIVRDLITHSSISVWLNGKECVRVPLLGSTVETDIIKTNIAYPVKAGDEVTINLETENEPMQQIARAGLEITMELSFLCAVTEDDFREQAKKHARHILN
jgi:hypothetical protein